MNWLEKLRAFVEMAKPYIQNMVMAKIAAIVVGAIGVSVISVAFGHIVILWYALENNLPFFECVDALSGREFYLTIAILVMLAGLTLALLMAGLLRLQDPSLPKFGGDDDAARKSAMRLNWISWRVDYLLSFIIFSVVGVFLMKGNFGSFIYCFGFFILFLLSCYLYVSAIMARSGSAREMNPPKSGYKWNIFFASFVFIILVFAALLSSSGRAIGFFSSEIKQIGYGDEFVSVAYINVVPLLSAIIVWWSTYIIHNRSAKHIAITISFVVMVGVGYWPGFSAFVNASFRIYKVGGPIRVSMYVEPKLGCEVLAVLEGKVCSDGNRDNVLIGRVNMLLKTDGHIYIEGPRSGDDNKSVIVVSMDGVGTIVYH